MGDIGSTCTRRLSNGMSPRHDSAPPMAHRGEETWIVTCMLFITIGRNSHDHDF